ncbi:MAG: hypothetical protein RLZZ342_491 [Candidatus Parcubacteria bacterium]
MKKSAMLLIAGLAIALTASVRAGDGCASTIAAIEAAKDSAAIAKILETSFGLPATEAAKLAQNKAELIKSLKAECK